MSRCSLLLLLLLLPRVVGAEEGRRVVFWGAPGVAEGALSLARASLAPVGEVVELPAEAASGPSAEAARLSAEASAEVEAARAAYYEARFAEAAGRLERYIEAEASALGAAGALDGLRGLLLWQGIALAKLGRGDEAAERFALSVALGQEEIDRALFPPDVTAAFDQGRELASGPAEATLTVALEPPEASLEVDGRDAEAPTVELWSGLHLLVARRPGHQPAARLVTVSADPAEAAPVALELAPAPPEVLRRQLAQLRRDGELDPRQRHHRALAARALEADLVAVVAPGTGSAVQLFDTSGEPAPWPVTVQLEVPAEQQEEGTPIAPAPTEPAERPVWRRWWFWVAVIGGAALVATGVGLGVRFGRGEDTYTIVVSPDGGR